MRLSQYETYRHSGVDWIGNVPAHWTVSPVKRGFALVGGSTPKSDEVSFWDGEIVWVSPADLSRLTSLSIADSSRKITEAGLNSCGTTMVPTGSLVLSTRAPIGSLAIAATELCTNQGCKSLVPNELASSRYFAYVLLSATTPLNLRGKGTTFLELSADELAAFKAPYPTLEEQAAIAAFLDHETAKIDGLIAEQEKLIALLAEKRQATISHAVTRGMNPQAPMKDSGVPWLGELPAHWRIARVKALSEFTTSGPRGWSERIVEDGNLFIQSGDLNDSLGLDYETAKRVNVGYDAEAARTRLAEGDVVICITGAKTGNVAVCSALREPAYVNQHLCLIRPTAAVHGRFLAFALKSTTGQLQLELSQYGLKQGLSLEGVREVWVAHPSRDEQEDIVAWLDAAMDRFTSLVTAAEAGVALLRERRSALIAAAVTGQIDVRGFTAA